MAKLIPFFTDPQKKALLEVEITSTIDQGRPFVTATYSPEGDGPLAFHCCKKIETIKAAIHTVHTPNLDAVARHLSTRAEKSLLLRAFPYLQFRGSTSTSQTLQQRIIQHGTTRVQPGLEYFQKHFNSTQGVHSAFKAAHYFSPHKN